MSANDSTGQGTLQEQSGAESSLVSSATKIRKYSRQFGWPFLLLLLVSPLNLLDFHESLLILFLIGCPSIGVGLALRLWARGYVGKQGVFVVDGPFRYVRNPVELGAVLAYAGAGIILGVQWWCNLGILVLAILYLSFVAIPVERQLYSDFGTTYLKYSQRVKRWWPSHYPAANRSNLSFSFLSAFANEKESLLWLAGYVCVYAIRRRFYF